MFNRQSKVVKKWREVSPPHLPITTVEQLELSDQVYALTLKTLDEEMSAARISPTSAEGVELLQIRARLVQRRDTIRKEFELRRKLGGALQ